MALGGGGQVSAQAMSLRHRNQHPPNFHNLTGQLLASCATLGAIGNRRNEGTLAFKCPSPP